MEETEQGEGNETPQTPNENPAPEVTPTPEPEKETVGSWTDPDVIIVDKRAIEFLERHLSAEAIRYFKENFLK